MEVIQPPDWARPKGYSNGIIATGKMFFVAGQVGWNKEEEFETEIPDEEAENITTVQLACDYINKNL